MSKKALSSAVTAVILAVIAIALASFIGKTYTALPDGTKEFKSIVEGCSKMSASKVKDSYGRSTLSSIHYDIPSLVSCETIDDYLKACGLTFDYMQDGGVTDKVYFVSAIKGNIPYSDLNEMYSLNDYNVIYAVVGADYTDADGEQKTAYELFYVLYSEKDHGILKIS